MAGAVLLLPLHAFVLWIRKILLSTFLLAESTKITMLPKLLGYHIYWLPKLLCCQDYYATKITMLLTLLYYQNYYAIKITMLPKLLYYQNYCATKITILPKLLCYQNY